MEGRGNVDSITICHSQSRSDRPKYSAETEAGTIKEFFPRAEQGDRESDGAGSGVISGR